MRIKLFYCLCILLLTMPSFAADSEIKDSIDDTWDVLIYPYPVNNTSEFALSIHSIFQVLEKTFRNVEHHFISEAERRSIARRLREEHVVEMSKDIDKKITDRDNLLFTAEDNGYKRWVEQRKMDKSIRKLQENAKKLAKTALSDIDVYTKRTIALKAVDENTIQTIEYAYHLNDLAHENEVEQIIYAEVEPLSDVSVYLAFSEYNAILNTHTVLTELIATLGDVEETIRRATPAVSKAIVGLDTANMVVSVKNEDEGVVTYAGIYIDGKFSGYGLVERVFVFAGEKTIDIYDGNELLHTREITLMPGESRELYFYVDESRENTVEITSMPPGAKVYVNSIQVGTTPIQISRSTTTQSIYLTKDDYYPAWVLINPRSSSTMAVNLVQITENSGEILRKKRELFYQSMGFMALSVPFPMIFSALYQGRASHLDDPSLSASAAEENKLYHDAFQGTFWGSLGVTLSLTGYMFYRLVDYIRYANAYDRDRIIE